MKYTLLLLLMIPLLAVKCEDDDPSVNPIDQLPPATQTGEYTFGCLVNGEAFVPRSTNKITAIYQGDVLQLGGSINANPGEQSIQLFIESDINVGNAYILNDARFDDARFISRGIGIPTCIYEEEETISGTLTITHFDSINFIVSGTFEFTTAVEDCDTIRVTDGRFDIPYIP